jgi:flagellar motor switch protein FliG
MKKSIEFLVFLFALHLAAPATAQDKIYSLSLKQHEIEEAIHKSLTGFLDPKDYVVKVQLKGVRRVETVPEMAASAPTAMGESLPGFEIERTMLSPKITDVVGNTYWQIESMRVDLIMHKEISPSVDTFIRETVPVVSEMDRTRGDVFNYVTIIPKTLAEAGPAPSPDTTPSLWQSRYYGLTLQELAALGLGALLVLLVLFLLWRLRRVRRNLTALEQAWEAESKLGAATADPTTALDKERAERLSKQETLLENARLRDENDRLIEEIITGLIGRPDWVSDLYTEFSSDKKGLEKLAAFLGVLGMTSSRKLFLRVIGEEKYLDLERMSAEKTTTLAQENALLTEFRNSILTKRITAPEMMSTDPFAFLRDLTPGQIYFLMREEPVKIKAVVLSQLTSGPAAEVITRLKKEERGQVIVQLGNINDLPLELIEKVGRTLAAKARDLPDDSAIGFDGVDRVVELISDANVSVREDLINNLRVADRKLSEKIESKLFLFESIPAVPPTVLTTIVRQLRSEDVMIAISGSPKALQEKVIMCFPEKIRRTLVASLKAQQPDIETIRAKQKLIVQAMQKMAENKKVDLRKIKLTWEKANQPKSA